VMANVSTATRENGFVFDKRVEHGVGNLMASLSGHVLVTDSAREEPLVRHQVPSLHDSAYLTLPGRERVDIDAHGGSLSRAPLRAIASGTRRPALRAPVMLDEVGVASA